MIRALLVALALSGCYVSARGGPGTMDVVLGAELHFTRDRRELKASPVDHPIGIHQELGFIRANVDGAAHNGGIYAVGPDVLLTLSRDRERADPAYATLIRAGFSLGFGQLAGLEEAGSLVRVAAQVEVERWWHGWALRLGGGGTIGAAQLEPRMPYLRTHGAFGAVTFEYTPLVRMAFHAIFR